MTYFNETETPQETPQETPRETTTATEQETATEQQDLNPDEMTTIKEETSKIRFTRKNLTLAYSKKGWTITKCASAFRKSTQFISGCLYAWEIPNPLGVVGNGKSGRGRHMHKDPSHAYDMYTGASTGSPMTTTAVARELGVSRTTAYNYIKAEARRRGEKLRTKYEAQWLRRNQSEVLK